jgi:hypothetical protein
MPQFIEENLRVIIFAVIVVIAVLQKVFEAAKAKKDNGGPTMKEIFGPNEEPTDAPPPRRAPYTPPPLVKTTVPPPLRQPNVPPPLRGAVAPTLASYDSEAELARQREMEERIRKIREARSSTPASAPEPPPPATVSTAHATSAHHGVLHRRLRHPRELRRAFILKEILDRPLGLR